MYIPSLFLAASLFLFPSSDGIVSPKNENRLNKLMIIALVGNYENRKTVEEEIRLRMSLMGMSAVSSYKTKLHSNNNLNKEMVIKICNELEADGVLIIKLVDIENDSGYSYNPRVQAVPNYYAWGNVDFNYGHNFTAIQSKQVSLQSDILTVADGAKVFEFRYSLSVGSDPEPAIGTFAKKLAKKIKKEKTVVIHDN